MLFVQEVWADGETDQSIIIELNSLDEDVADADAASSVDSLGTQ